ncbi:MAG TPA: hypothetical protein PLP19_22185 [bacterium]|nr:hypothetical protein [bacterium]HPN46210.1 hypothetical protein [bacterium]
MIADLILKFLDGSIELLKIKQDKRKNYFTTLIEPLYQNFEILHQDYLRSFENYRHMIKTSQSFDSEHPVLDLIVKEHLFSQCIRKKIKAASKLFPESPYPYSVYRRGKLSTIKPSSKARDRDEIEKFLSRVIGYFEMTSDYYVFNDRHAMIDNSPRSSLISGLKFIFSIDQKTALYLIEQLDESSHVIVRNSNPSAYMGEGKYKTPTDYYLFVFSFENYRAKSNPTTKLLDFVPDGMWDKLRNELQTTNGNLNKNKLNKIKSALAIGLIDVIVANIQSDYGNVQESYMELKKKFIL